jgi:hypothetical protein
MKILRYLLLILLSISFSSCSAKKESLLGKSKLLISIEKRDYSSDKVTEINFFDSGLKQEIVIHDTSSKENLFSTSLDQLNSKQLEAIKSFETKLNKLDYENSFPWKEGLYDRGNVYKISFISSKKLEYIARKDAKDSSEIQFEKILYYYQGHKESPELFKELVAFIETL